MEEDKKVRYGGKPIDMVEYEPISVANTDVRISEDGESVKFTIPFLKSGVTKRELYKFRTENGETVTYCPVCVYQKLIVSEEFDKFRSHIMQTIRNSERRIDIDTHNKLTSRFLKVAEKFMQKDTEMRICGDNKKDLFERDEYNHIIWCGSRIYCPKCGYLIYEYISTLMKRGEIKRAALPRFEEAGFRRMADGIASEHMTDEEKIRIDEADRRFERIGNMLWGREINNKKSNN